MDDFRESSKKRWNSNTSLEHINAGSLQRIADAMELSYKDRERLERELTEARRQRDYWSREAGRLFSSRAALKGVITQLKKAAAK